MPSFLPRLREYFAGGGVVPVLVRAEAGQRAAAIGVVDRAGRGFPGLCRFVEVVVRVAADLGSAGLAPENIQRHRVDRHGVLRHQHAGSPMVVEGGPSEDVAFIVLGGIQAVQHVEHSLAAEVPVPDQVHQGIVRAHGLSPQHAAVQRPWRPAAIVGEIDGAEVVLSDQRHAGHSVRPQQRHVDHVLRLGHLLRQISHGHFRFGESDRVRHVRRGEHPPALVKVGAHQELHRLKLRIGIRPDPGDRWVDRHCAHRRHRRSTISSPRTPAASISCVTRATTA